jgi:hypothetical protein
MFSFEFFYLQWSPTFLFASANLASNLRMHKSDLVTALELI